MPRHKAALTPKQEAFALHYASHGNARRAALESGYSGNADTQKSVGHKLLQQPKIKARVAELMELRMIDANEVMSLLASHARASLGDFIAADGKPDLAKAADNGLMPLVKKITWDTEGVIRSLELVDSQSAIVHCGRALGVFSDKIEHSGKLSLDNWQYLPDLSNYTYAQIWQLKHGKPYEGE